MIGDRKKLFSEKNKEIQVSGDLYYNLKSIKSYYDLKNVSKNTLI